MRFWFFNLNEMKRCNAILNVSLQTICIRHNARDMKFIFDWESIAMAKELPVSLLLGSSVLRGSTGKKQTAIADSQRTSVCLG